MKVLLCQTNTTPNDFAGNYRRICSGVEKGIAEQVDLIVFPELTLPGYLCRDMMFRKGFVEENLERLHSLCNLYQKSPHIVLGYIDKNHTGVGKPFRNMAAVIKNGKIVATYQKQLLPFYDVFDEGRYFQPGNSLTVVEICRQKWGICICEDMWNDKGSDDYNYTNNPVEQYRKIGVNNIISINSSPFVRGKPEKRIQMVMKSNETGGGTVIYCNQLGGQDELVFDGNSFVHHAGTFRRPFFELGMEPMGVVSNTVHRGPDVYDVLKMGLRDYIEKSGFKKVVVGSSGGIDSAVTIALACDVVGPDNVLGVRLPTNISSDHSKGDALQLHKNLGCKDFLVGVEHESFIKHIKESLKANVEPHPVADENIQARLRGMILMYMTNAWGGLLLSTGNKTELALGYCTLYGDMNGGFCPINDLYKMEVYELARQINLAKKVIPENIINKAPSAELAPGQTDEASLLPYPILDNIVRAYIEDYVADFDGFVEWSKWRLGASFCPAANEALRAWLDKDSPEANRKYNELIRKIDQNEFKRRQAAPGIKLTKVAFGVGRRIPIVKR